MNDIKFYEIVKQRYAVKKFSGRRIPEERLNELLEMVRLAPSSFNLQPWKVKVIADDETKKKLLEASYGQEQITTCSHLLVFCADTDIMGLYHRLEAQTKGAGKSDNHDTYFGMMKGFVENMKENEKLTWAQRQVYLCLGNALNGAKALGFDSCPMEGFNAAEYSKILALPANLVPTALCPIGYAADTAKHKLRFAKEEVLI